MVENSGGPGLALEPHQPVGVFRERFGENLDRDVATDPRVAAPVNLAHTARSER